jgi:TonB family protein
MDVTDVLRDRMREAPGLHRMVAVSALLHAALVAAVMVGPARWLSHREAPPPTVMTISLGGGASGVQSGGANPMGGRAIQTETPPDPKRPEPVTPPAANAPAMTVPLPGKTQVKTAPSPTVKQAPDVARGKTPTKGAETTDGSTAVETQVRGQGFGLSTSAGIGTSVQYEGITDFCCPGYTDTMTQLIRRNWDSKAETAAQVTLKFTIRRDGTITDTLLEKPSGVSRLDIAAQRAMALTRLPALPAEFPNPTLTVHLTFQYTR